MQLPTINARSFDEMIDNETSYQSYSVTNQNQAKIRLFAQDKEIEEEIMLITENILNTFLKGKYSINEKKQFIQKLVKIIQAKANDFYNTKIKSATQNKLQGSNIYPTLQFYPYPQFSIPNSVPYYFFQQNN